MGGGGGGERGSPLVGQDSPETNEVCGAECSCSRCATATTHTPTHTHAGIHTWTHSAHKSAQPPLSGGLRSPGVKSQSGKLHANSKGPIFTFLRNH